MQLETSIETAPQAPVRRSERDLRIDWFRGMSLLFMYLDHVPQNILASFTLQRFQFIDTAEVFVFLSGYVSGIVYTSAYLREGLAGCFRKALRRCRQLYVAQLLMFVASCAVLGYFAVRQVYVIRRDPTIYEFLSHPLRTFLAASTLLHAPGLTGLLPLYMCLIAVTPLVVYALNHRPLWLAATSIGLYIAIQFAPKVNFYFLYPNRRPWEFNPALWQLIFVAGLLLGSGRLREWHSFAVPKWLVVLCLAALFVIATLRCVTSPALAHVLHTDVLRTTFARIPADIPYTDKEKLAPLRVLNLAILAAAGSVLSQKARFWKSSIARPVIRLGANSLPVYAVSIVVSYAVVAAIDYWRVGPVLAVVLTIAGMLLLFPIPRIKQLLRNWAAAV